MAKGTSAEKAHRQSLRRRDANRRIIRSVRTLTRRARMAIAEGSAEERASRVQTAAIALDKAAAKGTLHKNSAARRKSRLMKALNKAAAEE